MRRTLLAVLSAAVIGILGIAETSAQTKTEKRAKTEKKGTPSQKKASSPRQAVSRNFARGPAVGTMVPDITAFDADGKPFRLRSIKGSHTVIVFGCLT